MTEAYLQFPKKSCSNVSSPCWIPQADAIIRDHIKHSLPQCDTIEKYGCMLDSLRLLRGAAYDSFDLHCMKSCLAEIYKIDTFEGEAVANFVFL